MTAIINLNNYKRSIQAKKVFKGWAKRFNEFFNENTTTAMLSNTTLMTLCESTDESNFLLCDLIIKANFNDDIDDFESLPSFLKLKIIESTLFLNDIFRLECMRRLSWISELPVLNISLYEIISEWEHNQSILFRQLPLMTPACPGYHQFNETHEEHKDIIIRKLIPRALDQFRRKAFKK
jgi:hypothetical protein